MFQLETEPEIAISTIIQKVDLSLSGIYHKSVDGRNTHHYLLPMQSNLWQKKFLVFATLANLFNKRNYIETSYSGVGILQTAAELRPRWTDSTEFRFSKLVP